jgi:hypothetical protein
MLGATQETILATSPPKELVIPQRGFIAQGICFSGSDLLAAPAIIEQVSDCL